MKHRLVSIALLLMGLTACSDSDDGTPEPQLTRQELMDPETCKSCHERHYREWSGSMHAYAANDPVFLAMNERGQEETDGELGDFCVNCHAPMAVREGLTEDGRNLDEVPQHMKGVTCYFCHNVEAVGEPHHNNPLELADDRVMRGGIDDPVANSAHASAYSPHLDGSDPQSADMCGSCHDIVTPGHEVHLERTFAEWNDSLFSDRALQTCVACHMHGRDGLAADGPDAPSNVRSRRAHGHAMVGVDTAFETFPEDDPVQMELQRRAIECELLNAAQVTEVCVDPLGSRPGSRISVTLEAIGTGHRWPSGAVQDRRAWLEMTAYDEAGNVLRQVGKVAEGEPVVDVVEETPEFGPKVFRDHIFGPEGDEVHMFWEAAKSDAYPEGYESNLLPEDQGNNEHDLTRSYELIGQTPARIEIAVHIRPMGLDVIDSLIDSGHLDEAIRDRIPTFTLEGTRLSLELDPDDPYECMSDPKPESTPDCKCLYEDIVGDGSGCRR